MGRDGSSWTGKGQKLGCGAQAARLARRRHIGGDPLRWEFFWRGVANWRGSIWWVMEDGGASPVCRCLSDAMSILTSMPTTFTTKRGATSRALSKLVIPEVGIVARHASPTTV